MSLEVFNGKYWKKIKLLKESRKGDIIRMLATSGPICHHCGKHIYKIVHFGIVIDPTKGTFKDLSRI